jgi:hypothetical protein
MRTFVIAVLAVSGLALAATVPSGWKVVADRKKVCQYAVPADWTQDKLLTSVATSPDKKSSVVIHSNDQPFDQVKSMIKSMLPPVKMIEDSSTRYWYAYKQDTSADLIGTHWYVAVPGNGLVCAAQVSFDGPEAEKVAKQIVESIGPMK